VELAVTVVACGTASSGIPGAWAAGEGRPGVNLVELTANTAAELAAARGDRPLVVSIHWGGNWGWAVPPVERRFAHRLIDAGVDLVHGHSSHHPRPSEVYRGRLVIYGTGDFIDDYEGIRWYEAYRDDLRLMYFAELAPSGELASLRMVPLRARRLTLERALASDLRWLAETLTREGRRFGTRVELSGADLALRW
jgi:poly-gamma-glutamate synthesis protein (capsule biosynthesis protein)